MIFQPEPHAHLLTPAECNGGALAVEGSECQLAGHK